MSERTIPIAALQLHAACSTDQTRGNLTRVHVDKTHAVATDGHQLVQVDLDQKDHGGAVEIPASLAKSGLQTHKRVGVAPITVRNGDGKVELISCDGAISEPVEEYAPYPDTASILDPARNRTHEFEVCLDVAVLNKAVKAMGGKLGANSCAKVELSSEVCT